MWRIVQVAHVGHIPLVCDWHEGQTWGATLPAWQVGVGCVVAQLLMSGRNYSWQELIALQYLAQIAPRMAGWLGCYGFGRALRHYCAAAAAAFGAHVYEPVGGFDNV